jgi:hypothetical protein
MLSRPRENRGNNISIKRQSGEGADYNDLELGVGRRGRECTRNCQMKYQQVNLLTGILCFTQSFVVSLTER